TWGTGCGSGGTSRDRNNPPYAAVGAEVTMGAQAVLELAKAFQSRSGLWRETGGVHACALADEREILVFAEDVGRHNAFDKVMGIAAMEGIAVGDKLVLTTGRLSAEIVSKAVACGVPILASRSAVTGLAISLAKRFGMTLVGFMRGGRLNVYSGYERLTGAG
ncbi:MAG: formate dehydrogenase accessory sulfurtransferase FdhD, partial [Planctomycetes bacterium]|nr:formate dehydrogenase accessory sulfurtransferase FdhD [Planctomycetota bacterium]